ncbi:hypothetical protein NGB36_11045 [Streptomyces sp. RB6PN25]|uniref:Putative T7SS secretion signal domain-containing protein n=1 Tax=Streptomyces humicola TaxID=2953240 RepID=A0ABT1PTX3_9ACTN|nr:hypothetical protein [Streptomyces humicola]MCQ4081124.1 hypothetical protein [Streptomyces humicola]
MRRPPAYEWEVLGEPGDPVPGDPDAIALLGESLRGTANAIQQDVRDIQALAGVEAWQSKAADTFRSAAHDAVADLQKAYHRYDIASDAIGASVREDSDGDWASAVEMAQQQAAKALRDAHAAQSEQQAATRQLDQMHPDDPQRGAVQQRHDAATGDLDAAKRELQAAKSLYETAASTAAARIHRAITHDGMHDTFGDQVSNIVGKVEGVVLGGGEILEGAEGVQLGVEGVIAGVVAMATGAGTVPGAIETGLAAADVGFSVEAIADGVGRLRAAIAGETGGDWDEEAARSLRGEDNYIRPEAIQQLTPDEILTKKGRVFGANTGDRMTVRTVRTKTDLDNIWDKLTDGAPKPPPGQKLAFYVRPDGTRIQYRNDSTSTPSETIDVFPPGGRKQAWKIHQGTH